MIFIYLQLQKRLAKVLRKNLSAFDFAPSLKCKRSPLPNPLFFFFDSSVTAVGHPELHLFIFMGVVGIYN